MRGNAATSPAVKPGERPRRHLLHAEHVRLVGRRERDHLVEERAPLRRDGVPMEEVPAPDEHASTLLPCASCSPTHRRSPPGTTTSSPLRSRARAPTSSSRRRGSASATLPDADGYRRSERFYPVSSRLFKRSRLRLPLKAVEHLDVLRSLSAARADVLHLQWLALPQAGRAPALPLAVRLHRARPAAAPHSRHARISGAACSSASIASSSTRSAGARRSPSWMSTRASSPTPCIRARRRAPTTARRSCRSV